MLTDATPWVLCEWHTDFICAGLNGAPPHHLVSVKHREPDQGAWPLSEMAKRGGLATLYKRWNDSGRKHNCRWVTNGGLKPGEMQTRNLCALLSTNEEDFDSTIIPYATYLRDQIDAQTLEDATNFLGSLTLFSTGGDARSFRAQVIDDVARPVLAQLGARPGLAHAAYRAVHELVVDAVEGLDPNVCIVNWYSGDEATSFDAERRRITRERLLRCLEENGIAIPPDSLSFPKEHESVMIRKLRAGGLGPTILAAAPRIRQQWYELEVYMRPDIPNSFIDELDRIRAEVALRAGQAESKYRIPGTSYGVQMHHELADKLSCISPAGRVRLSQAELMGCAYQLADECEIWWSDQFDTSTEAPRLAINGKSPSAGSPFTQGELPFD